ncbi:putative DNA helicase [Dioscorea sansibarensis]
MAFTHFVSLCWYSINYRLKDLLMLMKSSSLVDKKSVIIYCKFQAETDIVTKYLCDNNILAKGYHSSLPARDRNRIQELFCSNKIRVVVATVAFGMGLDKSDVDVVIHYSLPESLEEYIQISDLLVILAGSDGVDEYAINKLLCQIFSDGVVQDGHTSSLVKESASRKFDMKEEVLIYFINDIPVSCFCVVYSTRQNLNFSLLACVNETFVGTVNI